MSFLPTPKTFLFKGFVPGLQSPRDIQARKDEQINMSLAVPCRVLESAGLVRSWDFRPTEHGRQTIPGVRPARAELGEVPGAFNGVVLASAKSVEELREDFKNLPAADIRL
jgi:hypothetical protein